jgi:hypothetical protein
VVWESGDVPIRRDVRSPPAVKLAFWIHQLTEYLLGFMVVTQAVRSDSPLIPVVAGGLVVAMAAIVDGPLSVAKLVSRPLHRWVDGASAAVLAVSAALFHDRIGTGTVVVMAVTAAGLLYLIVRSDYRPKPRRELRVPQLRRPVDPRGRSGSTSRGDQAEQLGRRAGRGVGAGARWVKRRIDDRR